MKNVIKFLFFTGLLITVLGAYFEYLVNREAPELLQYFGSLILILAVIIYLRWIVRLLIKLLKLKTK